MWWWHPLRPANIPENLRTELERYGEDVVAQALATAPVGLYAGPLYGTIQTHHPLVLDWLNERRAINARREDRIETLEWAILIFIGVEIVLSLLDIFVFRHQ